MKYMSGVVRRLVRKCLFLLSKPVKATQWYQSLFVDFNHKIFPDNVWYRENEERNFDVVNLGSSSAKWAFDWSTVGVKGMNWANQPQTLIDDFRLLKNFHSILKKNGVVIITIMPFTGLNKTTGLMDTFKYLGTLYWDVIKDMPFAEKAQIFCSYPILFGKPAFKAVIKHVLGREIAVRDWRLDVEKNPMTHEEQERDAQGWITGWVKQFNIKNLDDDLSEENRDGRKIRVRVMQEIVDFCRERGYRPVYVIPPVTKALNRCYTEKFKKLFFYDFLQEVDRNVPIFDYLMDDELSDSSLYFNSFFLNKRGRNVFTKRVLCDIGSRIGAV